MGNPRIPSLVMRQGELAPASGDETEMQGPLWYPELPHREIKLDCPHLVGGTWLAVLRAPAAFSSLSHCLVPH